MTDIEYPKDVAENVSFRSDLWDQCSAVDKDGHPTQKALDLRSALRATAKENVFMFFNVFLWTYDPRPDHAPADKPFITYPKQNDFIRWLEKEYKKLGEVAGFTDKPRDVGFSYVFIGWCVWHWLFDEGFNAHLGSRVQDLVEKKGDPDTLFFKADYMIKHLPPWLLPERFDITKNHRFMIIDRPDNSNTITGEAASENFGRGGRHSVTLLDEFGFWQWSKSAWESCGSSTHFRLAGTTPPPTGKSSHAYKLRSGQVGKCDVFNFDFSDVPWKTQEWLKRQREGRSTDEYSREVMKSYDISTEGKVYALEWSQVRRDEFLDMNPNLPLYVSWDFGFDGTALVWWQKDPQTNWNYVLESYVNKNLEIGFFVPFVTGNIMPGFTYEPWELEIIRRHKTWRKPDGHFGDPDVEKRSYQNGQKLKEFLAQAPRLIYVEHHEWADIKNHYQVRELTKLLFRRMTINPIRAQSLDEAMMNARYPTKREESESTTSVKKPVHDYTSHPRTSLEYYVLNEPEVSPESVRGYHPAGTEQEDQEELSDPLTFRSLHG